MAHLEPIQTNDAARIPRTESRCLPELGNYEDISLQFSVCSQQYTYPLPRFTFRQLVATFDQWQERQHRSDTELDLLSICAIELVEVTNVKGKLTQPPHWRYGLRTTTGTKELIWFDESELVDASTESNESID